MKKTIKFCMAAIFLAAAINAYPLKYENFQKQYFAMGSYLSITIFTTDENKAEKIFNNCHEIASGLENKISCKEDTSIISLLNLKKSMKVEDHDVLDLIASALYCSRITNGAFDPALFNITSLWGFDTDNPRLPGKNEIDSALNKTGYKNITMDNDRITLKNGVSLDLGGIGKGKLVGLLSGYLLENGIMDFIVNSAGSSLSINGLYGNKRLWKIAIVNPFEPSKIIGFINLSTCSISTSGDYERRFTGNDGKIYHHILDPKTGYPANNGIHSVTIINNDPTKADALTTGIFVLGIKKGIELAKKLGIGLIIISGDRDKPVFTISDNIGMSKNTADTWIFSYNREQY